jgi:hypothetical protein
MANKNMKPKHFFIIGAQRSGTTSLAKILDEHPQIIMAKPLRPEPKYFINTDYANLNYNQYLKLFFPKISNNKLLGEKTTAYIDNDVFVGTKIKKIISNFKCIIILRDPIIRALSHWKFSKKNALENLNFSKAIKLEKIRSKNWKSLVNKKISSNPFAYIERSKYYKYILQWEKLVKKKNLIILINENFFQDINNVKILYKKLGVNENFVPKNFNLKFNKINHKENYLKNLKIIKFLKKKFKKNNTLLLKRYNLDLSKWNVFF